MPNLSRGSEKFGNKIRTAQWYTMSIALHSPMLALIPYIRVKKIEH